MLRCLLATILFLALGTTSGGGWIVEGHVVGISDGDTITVLDDAKTQHKIRFAGIDAPEKGQAFAERSKQSLSALVFQKRVEARCHKKDRFGRVRDGAELCARIFGRRSRYLFVSLKCEDIMMNAPSEHSSTTTVAQATTAFHGVRYLVADVKRAIDFYTTHLGFNLEHQQLPVFATVALGPLRIHLSRPGASGSRPLPGGERQSPGGSNRVVLRVRDLPAVFEALRSAGAAFRNTMETGPAGRQIQVLDPDGNPVELFEPAHRG